MRSHVSFLTTTSYDENEAELLAQILNHAAISVDDPSAIDTPLSLNHARLAREFLDSMSEAAEEIARLRALSANDSPENRNSQGIRPRRK